MNFNATSGSFRFDAMDDDSQVGAMGIAPVAGSALFGVRDDRMAVLIQAEHTGRAELDAQPAAFTPHTEDDYAPARPAPLFDRDGPGFQ
jgi:hypothetical protein